MNEKVNEYYQQWLAMRERAKEMARKHSVEELSSALGEKFIQEYEEKWGAIGSPYQDDNEHNHLAHEIEKSMREQGIPQPQFDCIVRLALLQAIEWLPITKEVA